MNIRKTAALMLGAALIAAPGLAFAQDEQSFKGMIVSNNGNSIVVRTDSGEHVVNLTPDTKIRGTQGAGLILKDTHPPQDLIRGLAVEVEGDAAGEGFTATSVTFKTSDLKTAKQISAGISETEAGVAANKQAIAEQEERLNNVGNLVPAGRTKVYFASGKTALSEEGKSDLQTIAAQAKAIKGGFRLAVVGRADTTGDAAANKRLSARRAAVVRSYLIEQCGVLPTNFVPSTALGEDSVSQDPDPPKTEAEARRVAVTIMVSKANASAPG